MLVYRKIDKLDALLICNKEIKQLIEGGYLRETRNEIYLTDAGLVSALRGLKDALWWLIAKTTTIFPPPLLKYGSFHISPFSWILWEKIGEECSFAIIVEGFRDGKVEWISKLGPKPFTELRKAREQVTKAREIYLRGGRKEYASRLLEDACRRVNYSAKILNVDVRAPASLPLNTWIEKLFSTISLIQEKGLAKLGGIPPST